MTDSTRSRKLRYVTVDIVPLRSLVLALFLVSGVLTGYAAALRCSAGTADELRQMLDAFRSSDLPGSDMTAAMRTAVCYFRAPLLAFLLGFASIGVIALPMLLTAQGFVLSFSLFSFAEAVGRDGFALLPALFGLRLLFVVPCTFTLGVAALERSWALWSLLCGRRARPVSPGLYRFAVCCVCLLLGCVLELWLVPLFLRAAA